MASPIQSLTDATFAQAIRDATRPVLVDFGARWCPPCKAMLPSLEAIARERADVVVVAIDVDDAPGVAGTFGVRAMPTLLLFRVGQPVAQLVGGQSRARLDAWLDVHLSKARVA